MLNLRFTAGVGVGISGACERAPATELVFWHRASASAPKGCGLLFSFQSLFYLFALSAFSCYGHSGFTPPVYVASRSF